MNKEQLAVLAQKYLNGTATEQEKQLLNEWYDAVEKEMDTDPSKNFFITSEETGNRILGKMMGEVNATSVDEKIGRQPKLFTRINRMSTPVKWAAAAVISSMMFLLAAYFLKPAAHKDLVSDQPAKIFKAPELILPGGNKARLVLATGEVVMLENVKNGSIKNNSGLEISKHNGELIFSAAKQKGAGAPMINTVFTPRGGQYQLHLPDGSKVWLNAASSLKFPSAFPGKTREVELTGEGYFEIAKNASQPFHVKVNNMQVEVLGTHFNIMSYPDENEVNTTLLEGSVKISQGSNSGLLKPGQQASINKDAGKIKITAADVDQAIAWKNGLFQFEGATTETVMKQLARWYNIEVQYKGNFPAAHFRGMISRSVDLAQVINMLELTGELHFKIEDKKVTVMP